MTKNLIATCSTDTPKQIDTTCPYCGVGCGVNVTVDANQALAVSGRPEHPANHGKLCVKGSSLDETLSNEGRLLRPQINGRETSWDNALDTVANHFKSIIKEHGPQSVAFYLSGQLLSEDYYVANKLMKGFIGSANIDTNSRLCMASAVVAHKRAFGADAVPACYEDLEKSDVIFLTGSNAAYAHPIVFQRIVKAQKERGIKVVVIDPRRTASCDIADLHLALKPGSDAYFYNGLLCYLADNNLLDQQYISTHCDGFEEALKTARSQVPDLESAANYCDIPLADIAKAYRWFGENERVVTLFSQGINQSSSGVDKGNAIINCHLATGKIGKEGAAPFSITGQPNAMGGREVGGLANQLAAHMGFNPHDIEIVETFWNAPNIVRQEGLKAVDLFDAIHRGDVKAIWIMGTNPVVSMPNANKVREALKRCEMVVVSECVANTDTAKMANVLLPATTWGEKFGTVTNSERTISLQRPFLTAPGEALNDWQIISRFACKMGFAANFDYQSQYQIFAEHAALSGFKQEQSNHRAFDISGLKNIDEKSYQELPPTQWPVSENHTSSSKRLFSDGQFFTANGRAKLIPISARFPERTAKAKQFVMNSGRIRDQWHTMTRTGKAPRLLSHISEPYVQMHPNDAAQLDIFDGQLVQCSNLSARYIGRAKVSTDQRQGEIFVPMHWNDAYTSAGRAGALVLDIVDPLCGQPEFKHSPVNITKYQAGYHGMLLSTAVLDALPFDYWSKIPCDRGQAFYFATPTAIEDKQSWLQSQFIELSDWVTMDDGAGGYRALGFKDDRLCVAFHLSSTSEILPNHSWLSQQLGEFIPTTERFTLLASRPGDQENSPGPIVCACFQVGENQINAEIENGANSVEALGETLKCGTNCGSCIPELSNWLATKSLEKTA